MVSNAIGMTEEMGEPRFSKGMASGIFNAAGDLGYVLGPMIGGGVASVTGIPRSFLIAPGMICLLFFLTHLGVRLQRRRWA
jgi:MFS family permease